MSEKVSPIRKQYLEIKRQYPQAILFFRLGDFYETFDDDAHKTADILDIVLTSRSVGNNMRIPMAGIPHHAAESYIGRLIQAGYHVAICEQVGETPARGIFAREVVRVITPGTIIEPGLLPGDGNNYLLSAVVDGQQIAVAYTDISTGEFAVMQTQAQEPMQILQNELTRIGPAEVILPESLLLDGDGQLHISYLPDWRFEAARTEDRLCQQFGTTTLDGFGLSGKTLAVRAAGAILDYLEGTQPAVLNQLKQIVTYSLDEFMVLDNATRRNLELVETLRGGQVKGSLLGVLDRSVTPMGRRLLRQWISKPLLDKEVIDERLDRLQVFYEDGLWRAEVRAALKPLGDLERISNRITVGVAGPKDLVALRNFLESLPAVVALVQSHAEGILGNVISCLDLCEDIHDLLQSAISQDPPATLARSGVIAPGYAEELDNVLEATRSARDWIANLEAIERERTGIKKLKVGYNKVFGYYIEVTRANTESVPDDYIRKQTLVNSERYITPEMKEVEARVLVAEEEIRAIEARLFVEICRKITAKAGRLLSTALALAQIDVSAGLAEVAAVSGYIRPEILTDETLQIHDSRHPVVEVFSSAKRFVPNDVIFGEQERIRIITGPNMSGKSTYLRQVAIIVLMAQMGSFVPAAAARIGVADRIFTRIGAQDEIHAGQSTFMVEMVEAANILHHATRRSLLILDEIGRGTSTYDGLSIAWAMIEYLHSNPELRARTLFATHYHELTRLSEILPGVRNYNVAVSEQGGEVVFLYTIIPGGADKSYGIHVAELAGMPRIVINRANEVLARLEAESRAQNTQNKLTSQQLAFFPETNPLLDELFTLKIDTLTPLEALNILYEWQRKFSEEQDGISNGDG